MNEADEAPAGTVTLAGTVTALLLLARATLKPLERAGAARVTVHVGLAAPVNEVAAHDNELIVGVTFWDEDAISEMANDLTMLP